MVTGSRIEAGKIGDVWASTGVDEYLLAFKQIATHPDPKNVRTGHKFRTATIRLKARIL
jgi:hypothetical protein